MDRNYFRNHFGYGSFLPIIIFFLGIYTIFLFLTDKIGQGNFIMLLSLFLYILNNVVVNIFKLPNPFDEFLENMSVFVTFGIPTIIFGILFYRENFFTLLAIFFYSICIILSLARNNIMSLKNSIGWPMPLNGLFFPLIYYFYKFYLGDVGNSIFLFYYIIVGFLSISNYNFLGYDDIDEATQKTTDKEDAQEDEIQQSRQIQNQMNKQKVKRFFGFLFRKKNYDYLLYNTEEKITRKEIKEVFIEKKDKKN